jgi:hypothetical protein
MIKKGCITALLLTTGVLGLHAQFSQVPAAFVNVYLGASDWADFNNDGNADLAIAGLDSLNVRRTVIYKNNSDSSFSSLPVMLPGLERADVKWCDFNNDGWADLFITGNNVNDETEAALYSNNGNETFSKVPCDFTGIKHGEAAWCDYNRDGLQDVVITGDNGSTYTTILYTNKGDSTFTANAAVFPGLLHSTAEWSDYNRDGFPDLLLNGHSSSSSSPSAYVFSNNGDGTFSAVAAGITGAAYGAARWGDFNNDGMPDVFVSGSFGGLIANIYRNNGDSTFTKLSLPALEGLFHCDASVSDFNNDGFQDILLSGHHGPKVFLYKNSGDFSFTKETPSMVPVGYASVVPGDFNADGKPDVLLSGEIAAGGARKTRLYANQYGPENNPPAVPANLISALSCGKVVLNWTKGQDQETPGAIMSGAVYIGTAPGKSDILSSGSDLATGRRLVNESGNAGTDTFMIIRGLKPGTYYWGVQSVDMVNSGSIFSDEMTFQVPVMPEAYAGPDRNICSGQDYVVQEQELNYTPTGHYIWTTSGTGHFEDNTVSAPVYCPSADDLLTGSVILTFHVSNDYYCTHGAEDNKLITWVPSSIGFSGNQPELIRVCEGSDTAISVTASGEGLAYQWISSLNGEDWTVIPESDSWKIALENVTEEDERFYSCVVTDVNHCADTTDVATQVLADENPVTPVITASAGSLVAGIPFTYHQWLDNTGMVLSETDNFSPAVSGVYFLRVSDNQLCWSVSEPYAWTATGMETADAGLYTVYPNPVSDKLMIRYDGVGSSEILVRLYDMEGKLRNDWRISPDISTYTIPMGQFERGVYLLEIMADGKAVKKSRILLK